MTTSSHKQALIFFSSASERFSTAGFFLPGPVGGCEATEQSTMEDRFAASPDFAQKTPWEVGPGCVGVGEHGFVPVLRILVFGSVV